MNEMVPIPNYEGLYSITGKGKVYSHRFDRFVPATRIYDHPMVCLYKEGHGRMYSIKCLLNMIKEG